MALADDVRVRLDQIRLQVDEVISELEIAGDDLKERLLAKLKEVHTELGEAIEAVEEFRRGRA